MNAIDRLPPRQGRLVLELRAGEKLLINGAVLQVRSRCEVMLCNRARFLFGRQVMDPALATTPARRLYLAIQEAYVAPEEERSAWREEARRLAAQEAARRGPDAAAAIRAAVVELDADRGREALTLVRRLFAEDDATAPVQAPAAG